MTASASVPYTGKKRSSARDLERSPSRLRRCDERQPAARFGDPPLGAHEGAQRRRVDERALGEDDHLAPGRERLVELLVECRHRRQIELADDVGDTDSLGRLRPQGQVRLGHDRDSSPTSYVFVIDTILLTVPSGPRGAGVVALVLGGLGSRLDLPVDRIDELALAAATVAPSVRGDVLELEVDVLADRLVLRIGPLADGAGVDIGMRRVVDALVNRVEAIGKAGQEWLQLELVRGATG